MHTHVDLLTQASDPNPATTIVSHYSKAVAGNTEWFFQRENSGPVIQMSNLAGTPIIGSSGCTFLPGGLILQWGTFTTTNTASTVTFATTFPTNCYSVTLGAILSSNVSIVDVRLTQAPGLATFKAQVNVGLPPIACYYMAIGN